MTDQERRNALRAHLAEGLKGIAPSGSESALAATLVETYGSLSRALAPISFSLPLLPIAQAAMTSLFAASITPKGQALIPVLAASLAKFFPISDSEPSLVFDPKKAPVTP